MHGDAGSKWGATWDERGDVAARAGGIPHGLDVRGDPVAMVRGMG